MNISAWLMSDVIDGLYVFRGDVSQDRLLDVHDILHLLGLPRVALVLICLVN